MQKYKRISSTVDLSDTIIRKIFEMTTKKAIRQTQKNLRTKKKWKIFLELKKKLKPSIALLSPNSVSPSVLVSKVDTWTESAKFFQNQWVQVEVLHSDPWLLWQLFIFFYFKYFILAQDDCPMEVFNLGNFFPQTFSKRSHWGERFQLFFLLVFFYKKCPFFFWTTFEQNISIRKDH